MTAPATTQAMDAWSQFAANAMAAMTFAHAARSYVAPDAATLKVMTAWATACADALLVEWHNRFGA